MNIVNLKPSEIIPYVNNPRHNETAVDAVASSIRDFGFNVPIVLDKDRVIITGHTRHQAAIKLGLETVPCIIADHLTPVHIKYLRESFRPTGRAKRLNLRQLTREESATE